MYERSVIRIAKYLARIWTYLDLLDGNRQLSTRRVVHKLDKLKFVECYVDASFSGGWAQADTENVENSMSHTGYIITYEGCPVLWCIQLRTEFALSTTEA